YVIFDASPRALRSFPTRRSSDLTAVRCAGFRSSRYGTGRAAIARWLRGTAASKASDSSKLLMGVTIVQRRTKEKHCSPIVPVTRSEEHTSELQSRENLVCRLLLE